MGKGFEYFPENDIQITTNKWKDGQRHYIRECKSKPQWDNTSCPLGWLLPKKKVLFVKLFVNVNKLESYCTIGGGVIKW